MEELVSKYIKGTLSDSERIELMNRLENDAEYAQEFDLELVLQEAVIYDALSDWKEGINEASRSYRNKRKAKIISSVVVALVSISSLAIVILKPQNEKIVQVKTISTTSKGEASNKVDEGISFSNEIVSAPTITSQNESSEEVGLIEEKGSVYVNITVLDSSMEKPDTSIDELDQITVVEYLDSNKQIDYNQDSVDELGTLSSQIVDQNPVVTENIECVNQFSLASVLIESSCIGEQTGVIEIDSDTLLKDGSAYQLLNESSASDWQEYPYFSSLEAGSYDLKILQQDGCDFVIESIEVSEDWCYEAELAFNPYEEQWQHVNLWGREIKVEIYDNTGQLVFQESTETDFSWDGRNLFGNVVNQTMYAYYISIDDNVVKNGNVTVIY